MMTLFFASLIIAVVVYSAFAVYRETHAIHDLHQCNMCGYVQPYYSTFCPECDHQGSMEHVL